MRIIEIKAMNCIVSQNCLINCLDPKDLEETLPGDAIHMKTQRHTQTDTHTHRPTETHTHAHTHTHTDTLTHTHTHTLTRYGWKHNIAG